ncbi:MAG: protoporphyrinogen oxidase [Nitrospiraceae bacterium]
MAVSPKQVVVVGGGIAGLATAFALQERAAEVGFPLACTLIEAESEWGGKIVTHRVGELIIEAGPDSFLSQKPWALELCEKLGLSGRLINTNEFQKKTFVFSRGRLRELPEGLVLIVPTKLGPLFHSGLLSWSGIARMALDLVIPARRGAGDESLASFFRRRLGDEAFERLVEPLMAGIYAGDAEQMSLRATFPRFLDIEQQHGSLIRGMLAGRKMARPAARQGSPNRTMFVTLQNGLGEMVKALVGRITGAGATLMPARQVVAIRTRSDRPGVWTYDVVLEDGSAVSAEAVVLATPAFVSAELVRQLSPASARLLDTIPYVSTATVSLAYDGDTLGPSVGGFGFVIPRTEGRDLIAATWTSLKWSHRTPPTQALIRCYVGGAGREAILKADDEMLVQRVRAELRNMAGIAAEPTYVEVNRWERGMPQYTLGHLDRLEAIKVSLGGYKGLYLTGAAYRGVGIPDCIRDGSETAAEVIRHLAERH